jgi:NAD(P)H-flavin reductase
MKTYSSLIIEVSKNESGARIRIAPNLPVHALPGQYYLAFGEGSSQILPVPLFSFSENQDGMVLCGTNQPQWLTGTPLLLQGPFGKGFTHCLKSSRLAIFAVEKTLEARLYSLALNVINQGSDVAWISDELTIDLPPQVEILKETELTDAIAWSESCAIAAPHSQISMPPGILSISKVDRNKVEVLVDAPFVCGNAQCGVCAIETRHGWKLACKDGPVFEYGELFNE